ncbi:uncharacterized protein K02A2.6-like [Haliotis rufescens]|uniref:uncharacterized protein K02A2.6-like n=1 Tax=Haliotis rufescens TaxID=6454 RepID=UPI00201EC6D3|nr:uncharacterized protein K02A2.6-like [Haliotis rufescens]
MSRDNRECWRCGKKNHNSDNCYYKKSICHICQKQGHISRRCHEKPQEKKAHKPEKLKKKSSKVRYMDSTVEHELPDGSDEDADSYDDTLSNTLFTVKSIAGDKPIYIPMCVEGSNISLELDTGAGVTLISEEQYKREFRHIPLKTTNLPYLETYTAEKLPVLGKIQLDVDYNEQSITLPVYVVTGSGPALLSRNWLSQIQLDWYSIGRVNTVRVDNSQKDLEQLLSKYSALFDGSLGTVKGVKLHLSVKPGANPKFYKPRTVPYALQDKVAEELDRLEKIGVIEKVEYSEWAAPIVPILKPSGAVRIWGDYKLTVNRDLEVSQYPLPVPEDLLNQLNGGTKFTKLDLSQAYQQVLLDDESKKYVTVNTHKGLYRYTRLPFGVASAPALFQNVMDQVLQGLPATGDFIDDLYVTGKDDSKHLKHIDNVFERLDSYGIKLNKSKCTFLQPSMEYLGFRVDSQGIHPTESKIEAIRNAPRPTNLTELQSFLGCVNYYRKFIPDMSTVCAPLNKLLQKGTKFHWDSSCEKAFQKLCKHLTTSDVLVHYGPKQPLILAADASQHGLGAVIYHDTNSGERPIAFASRTLTAAEKNYSQIEKEALAIIFGIQKFHKYLYGRHFTLFTDHKPLTSIIGPKTGIPVLAASRLQRWAIQLSAYTYEIKYKCTKQNANADCLSRLPLADTDGQKPTSHTFWTREATSVHIAQLDNLPVTSRDISAATVRDKVLSRVKHFTVCGWPSVGDISHEFLPYYRRKDELTCEEGCLLRGVRVVVPTQYRVEILDNLHDSHPGIVRMKSRARIHVWWPNLDTDIEQLVRNCACCQSVQPVRPTTRQNPWIWPSRPYQRIHVDFAGPFMGENFLIVVDAMSKWPEVVQMKSTTTISTINVLRKLFSSNGLPDQLISDNGPQFTSHEFKSFLKKNGVKHILSSTYHPSSNGEAERFVRTFKTTMKSMRASTSTLQQRQCRFLLSYRTTPHSTTKTTPAELFMGRRIRTRLDLLRPDLASSVQRKVSPKVDAVRHFEVGDPVLVRDYRGRTEQWLQGVVLKALGPVTYKVQVENFEWKRHVDQLITMPGTPDLSVTSTTEDITISDRSESAPMSGVEKIPVESTKGSFPGEIGVENVPPGTRPPGTENVPVTETATRRYPVRERKQPDRLSY